MWPLAKCRVQILRHAVWFNHQTYWEQARFLLKFFHLFYEHRRLLVCGCVPGTGFGAPPRATGEDTIGKLSTQRACKLALVNRETLEDLVILGVEKKNKQKKKNHQM